jgi:hypothetical protein
MRLAHALALVAAAAVMVAPVADARSKRARTSAAAPVADRVGVSAHLFWLGRADVDARMAQLRAAGIRWLRDDFKWSEIERERGRYDWSRTDNIMGAAARHGVDVLAVLSASPAWASSDPTAARRSNYPPRDSADFARFAAAVARRYGEGGAFWAQNPGLPARPLQAVELWNEPWAHIFWSPVPDPAAYGRLAREAALAVSRRTTGVDILISADLVQWRADGRPLPWFEALVRANPGLLRLVHGLSVHPYPHPFDRGPEDTSGDRRWRFDRAPLAGDVAAAAGRRLPVWITEIGWSTTPGVAGAVSETQQAAYVTAAVRTATTTWAGSVARTFVYALEDSPTEPQPFHRGFGLRRADGTAKPAWAALGRLVAA